MVPKSKRVSIKDIAAYTGYSIATVSRVINGTNKFYSEKAKIEIEEAIRKLGYHPNILAKGLKEGRTRTIAYLVPQIDDYYTSVYIGMQNEAYLHGYSIVVISSDYNINQERVNISHIIENNYDGIIVVTGLLNEESNENLAEIFAGIPVVLIEGMHSYENILQVCVDVESVCERAVNLLIELGHKRIAYLSAPCRFETLRYRYQGYVKALKKHEIEPDPSLIFFDSGLELSRFKDCYAIVHAVLQKSDFTAMFIMSDWAAFTAIRVANEMGLRVPEDISIIGFDNLPLTEFTQPALTTISQNSEILGTYGIQLILDKLEGCDVEDVFLDADLIIRQSVAQVKKV